MTKTKNTKRKTNEFPIGKTLDLDGELYVVSGYQDGGKRIELLVRNRTVVRETGSIKSRVQSHWKNKLERI